MGKHCQVHPNVNFMSILCNNAIEQRKSQINGNEMRSSCLINVTDTQGWPKAPPRTEDSSYMKVRGAKLRDLINNQILGESKIK